MPMLDEDGEMIPFYRNEVHFRDSNQVDGTVIQEVKKGKDGVSVKLYDKQRALIELQKLIGESGGGGKSIVINNPWEVPYGPRGD